MEQNCSMGNFYVYMEDLPMLYRLSTTADLSMLPSTFPIFAEIATKLMVMEETDADGYILVAESAEDLEQVRNIVNLDTHPCEWAEYAGRDCKYVVAIYQLNNDFGIDLYLPTAIAPDNIKEEL